MNDQRSRPMRRKLEEEGDSFAELNRLFEENEKRQQRIIINTLVVFMVIMAAIFLVFFLSLA